MILDTSFIVDVMRGDKAAMELLDRLEAGSSPLRVPTPVLYELWEGIDRSTKPIRELAAVEGILEGYTSVPLTSNAAKRAGGFSAALIRRGQDIDDLDLLIAGIASEESAAVVTRNRRDFERIPDLRVLGY